MDRQPIRILLVEDDPDDVWIMRGLLGDRWDGPFDLAQVEQLASGIRRCQDEPFDVILLDLSLPDSQGLETFLAMHTHAGEVPIVQAMSLLGDSNFLVFIVVSMVVAGLMQFYFMGTAPFLETIGIKQKDVPAAMSVAQIAQKRFLLLVGQLCQTDQRQWIRRDDHPNVR